MDSSATEVRVISRVSAGLVALIGATLLTTIRVPPMPAAGISDTASIRVIRKKDANEQMLAEQEGRAVAEAMRLAALNSSTGLGDEVRLWVNAPTGEIVFRNEDRFRRCVQARTRRIEDPDCPSASDIRRMVFEDHGGRRRAAHIQALRGA